MSAVRMAKACALEKTFTAHALKLAEVLKTPNKDTAAVLSTAYKPWSDASPAENTIIFTCKPYSRGSGDGIRMYVDDHAEENTCGDVKTIAAHGPDPTAALSATRCGVLLFYGLPAVKRDLLTSPALKNCRHPVCAFCSDEAYVYECACITCLEK